MWNRRCNRIGRASRNSLLVLVQGFNHKSCLAISARLFSHLFYSGGFGRQMEKEGNRQALRDLKWQIADLKFGETAGIRHDNLNNLTRAPLIEVVSAWDGFP